jgi:hypothetical protein
MRGLSAELAMSPFLAAGFVALGLVAAAVGGLLDRETVGSHRALHQVTLGYPFHWITQDQAGLSPTFPTRLGIASPWESPTHLDRSAFAVDALLWLVVLLVVFIVIRALVRRARPPIRSSPSTRPAPSA